MSNIYTENNTATQICSSCGTQLRPEQQFCPNCGAPTTVQNQDYYYNNQNNSYNQNYSYTKQPTPPSNKGVIIVLAVVIFVLMAAIVALAVYLPSPPKPPKPTPPPTPTAVPTATATAVASPTPQTSSLPSQNPVQKADLNQTLNNYVSMTNNNLSVCVYNYKTGVTYSSSNANDNYPAWGFYVPIYLAYQGQSNVNYSTLQGILGPDANYSNNCGNAAINAMGGLSNVNSILRSRYNATSTTYGKYFAQSSSSGNNYTTANEACKFVKMLTDQGDYAKLNYTLAHFGINKPAGATVYAHAGTENISKRNYLNFYGVVRGYNSEYCVAILSRSYTGGHISQLLSDIHIYLEGGN